MNTISKKVLTFSLAILSFSFMAKAQNDSPDDSTGMPGDNFDLQGALELFKNSESPEDFEKKLNAEGNKVNNLDLNGDGEIDFIRVVDHVEGEAHALVLQVPVNETELQDVAAIEIEKDGAESARLQITGAEELFGKETIVEPVEEKDKKGTGKGTGLVSKSVFISVNVWPWHCVRYMYAPSYVVWVSSWRWRHYPPWWKPWRPHSWRAYHNFARPWHHHYRVIAAPRVVVAHKVYHKHRVSSPAVHARYKSASVHKAAPTKNRATVKQAPQNKNSQRKSDGNKSRQAKPDHKTGHRK